MSRFSVSPDQLFDRPWRAGHPFRPRCSRLRRWSMVLLLLVLIFTIGGYRYLTDSNRVRIMAEGYLSHLAKGHVEVEQATLSIFEGLRLENVRVHVEADPPATSATRPAGAPGQAPEDDSVIFSARTLVIHYSPRMMLAGQLVAQQIVIEKPRVYLVKDLDRNTWNFARLGQQGRGIPRPIPTRPGKPLQIPEVLLRNAQVEVSETRGALRRDLGFMAIDGQISASPEGDRYLFELQSRGEEGVGPLVSGNISPQTGEVDAQLRNFEFGRESLFGRDLQSMLPDAVRDWWNRHGIAGRLDIPALHYAPPRNGLPATFRIETALNGVTLMVPPQEWQSAEDIRRGSAAVQAALSVRGLYEAAGFGALPPVQVTTGNDLREVQGSVGLTDPADNAPPVASASDHGSAPAPQGALSATTGAPHLDAISDDGADADSSKSPAPAPLQSLASLIQGSSVTMRQVAGTLVFTPAGIDVTDLSGRIENNGVSISGHIDGYRPDATAQLRIASLKSEDIYIPPSPRYINSLPRQAREIYESIRPTGTCRFEVKINRPQPGARILASGTMDIVDGQFTLEKFPYPMRGVTGRIIFDSEKPGGPSWLRLAGIRARGPEGGANKDQYVDVEGKIGPFEMPFPEPGFDIWVMATNVNSDPQLRQSLPPEVEQALQIFKDPADPQSPHFHGDFWCHVFRAAGPGKKWTFDTDIKLDRTTGQVAAFPYPLTQVGANVFVREGHVRIEEGHARNGSATMNFDGRVVWDRKAAAQSIREEMLQIGSYAPDAGPPARFGVLPAREGLARLAATAPVDHLNTRIGLHVRGLPVDRALLSAIPADRRKWLEKLQVDGTVDVEGDLAAPDAPVVVAAAPRAAPTTAPTTGPTTGPTNGPADMALVYDLAISIHDARVTPTGSKLTMSGVGGTLHLGTDLLRIEELHGARGKGVLGLNGSVDWKGPVPRLTLRCKAIDLTLDRPLYQVLPAAVQHAWDALHPDGSIDADVSYNGFADGSDAEPAHSVAGIEAGAASLAARTSLAAALSSHAPAGAPAVPAGSDDPALTLPAGLHALLRPRHLVLTPEAMPYRFNNVQGSITLARDHVVLDNLAAAHGDGVFKLSGTGDIANAATWDLHLVGENVKVDDALRQALPAVLRSLVDSLKLRGVTDFRFPRLVYRMPPSSAGASAGVTPAGTHVASQTAPAAPDPQIDLTATIVLKNGSMDVGVPLEKVNGQLQLDAEVRDGHLASARGHVDVSQLSMAGRTLRDFHSDLTRVADRDELQLDRMSAELAGGSMAGRLNLIFPDDGPSRYNLDLVLRNADVRELTGAADPDISGDLTASLSLEGAWGDGASQRGRGDVTVAGKDMYHIPLVLGLLQVTNLALPIAEPFNRGSIRYSLDGKRVNFEKIDMRSDSMVMSGTGHLDFATHQVRMTFVTDNPGGLKVPFLRDLWQGARNELLKINVKGTIQEPKVETSVMGTFSTTIDEVFRGDADKR